MKIIYYVNLNHHLDHRKLPNIDRPNEGPHPDHDHLLVSYISE